MEAFHEQLAAFVREERRANRLTQTDLAQLAGVGRRFVSDLEGGKPGLRLAKVDDVLRVFGRRLGIVSRKSGAEDSEGDGDEHGDHEGSGDLNGERNDDGGGR